MEGAFFELGSKETNAQFKISRGKEKGVGE